MVYNSAGHAMKMYFHHNARSDAPRRSRNGPYIAKDYEGYQCPVTDKWVEGRSAHRENLKRTGCRLLEKGESRDAAKKLNESYEGNLQRIVSKTLG